MHAVHIYAKLILFVFLIYIFVYSTSLRVKVTAPMSALFHSLFPKSFQYHLKLASIAHFHPVFSWLHTATPRGWTKSVLPFPVDSISNLRGTQIFSFIFKWVTTRIFLCRSCHRRNNIEWWQSRGYTERKIASGERRISPISGWRKSHKYVTGAECSAYSGFGARMKWRCKCSLQVIQ